ncbi:MAG: multidrug efflux pump subunit AcrB [Gammaproteobacteria bacterium]|jgi:multidrug efflux pump subunit AcrB
MGLLMLLTLFARHGVACNLLMAMMLLAGAGALTQLNTQFFPNFELELITVRVTWSGASAEDVESAITNVIEQELRSADGLRKFTSSSSDGSASISLEYEQGSDMGVALDQVKERVALIRNLPITADEPEISRVVRYEPVAKLLLYGPSDATQLRAVARRVEQQLLARGIAKVDSSGVPEQEMAIQIPSIALQELNLSLRDVAQRVSALSSDVPAGTVGRDDVSRQLRGLNQRRSVREFETLALISTDAGQLVRLGDVAHIERRARRGQVAVLYKNQVAVELAVSRTEGGDSLRAARSMQQWLENDRPTLPANIQVKVFDASWELIRDRINLLLRNGIGGLMLVVGILFVFLNARVAMWVAVGIPVSFMAALAVLYIAGGSINMISLFALIMTLGIIVDDAIVVGEDALAHFQQGESSLRAAEGGALRMLAPVMSSSLTTIAAFLPLMMVGGIIGNILFDIPLVVVCVIVASLVESFLILPGHLRHAFARMEGTSPTRLRQALDDGFMSFREHAFRPLVVCCVRNAASTVCAAIALLMLTAGLLAGGRLPFNFFPSPEAKIITADISFVAGTPPARTKSFITHVNQALQQTTAALGQDLVQTSITALGRLRGADGRSLRVGSQFASITVELLEPDARSIRNAQFIKAWLDRISLPAGIESFTISERRGGPPGRDVDIRLLGDDAQQLKAAAVQLTQALSTISGVNGITDDMPFGAQQLIYELTTQGKALGLTVDEVGAQLRAAYDGRIAQIFQDGDDEIEVRVALPDSERHALASLGAVNITLPSGSTAPLFSVVELSTRRGFDILRHTNAQLSLRVSADIDAALNNNNAVIARLQADVLPGLERTMGVTYEFEGRRADQQETLADMMLGGAYALVMIYLVLAWVFSSYGWPLVVMLAIPFGLIGALAGHWLLGIDLTILSLFGLFGLSGIVVNDSIILVVFYKQLREHGADVQTAIIEAACLRLRAVLLTSLTTIAGLLPLMFETSLQAQFLIPMAVSIACGLAFATVLVLLVIPAMLHIHERLHERFSPTSAQHLLGARSLKG